MKIFLSRTYQKNETLSSLFIMSGQEVKYRCKTIELADNGNQRNVSCIPEGIYDCEKWESPEKGMVIRLLNVPGRDNIEIHSGNFVNGQKRDSKGCIIPGQFFEDINHDGFIDVGGSREAMKNLIEILPDKFKMIIA